MSSKNRKRLSVEELKLLVEPVARKHGVGKVYLFGSTARGEDKANSDYDFCIEKGEIKNFSAFSKLYGEMEKAIGTDIDIVTTEAVPPKILDEIRTEWVRIYG